MRKAGVLMPIFSLSSDYGIGTFGQKAYDFVDFLEKAGQSYWQILPLSPTGFGDSPYQSFSAYAGNPYFIDFDLLKNDGYLIKEEYDNINWGAQNKVDYLKLYNSRIDVLKKAYLRFVKNPPFDYYVFLNENKFWLDDYSLFMAIKYDNGGKSFCEWNDDLKFRNPKAIAEARESHKDEIAFYKVIEYFFHIQWSKLKKYANDKNIRIIGDIPIYVSFDSADLWCAPELFCLDENLLPIEVAGCPPDVFSKKGQLWGNPLYNWEFMKNQNQPYEWWLRRIAHTLKLYDVIRIDHFRGFESYYAVPFGHLDATQGRWLKGPGLHFFEILKDHFDDLPIIAEDLGFFTEKVKEMLEKTGFPGMKVLQFGFDDLNDNSHLPHNCLKNSVVYTGTHDNDTVKGWLKSLEKANIERLKEYLNVSSENQINSALIRSAFSTASDTVIIPMQDYLNLDSNSRINIPSTLGNNWNWRIKDNALTDSLAREIRNITNIYCRI